MSVFKQTQEIKILITYDFKNISKSEKKKIKCNRTKHLCHSFFIYLQNNLKNRGPYLKQKKIYHLCFNDTYRILLKYNQKLTKSFNFNLIFTKCNKK